MELNWQEAAGTLTLTWRERGGPAVAPPKRRGFGTRLLADGLARELDGGTWIEYRPEGVVCTITGAL